MNGELPDVAPMEEREPVETDNSERLEDPSQEGVSQEPNLETEEEDDDGDDHEDA